MKTLTYNSQTGCILEFSTEHYTLLCNKFTDDISIKINEEIIDIDQQELQAQIFQLSMLVDTSEMMNELKVLMEYRLKFRNNDMITHENNGESHLCICRGDNSVERIYFNDDYTRKAYTHYDIPTMKYFIDDNLYTRLCDSCNDMEFTGICIHATLIWRL